jgi:hypothetical protein
MILNLSEADIAKVLRYEQLIPAMETALSAFSAGQVIQPVRNMLIIEEAKRFLGIMPAVTEEGMGAKPVCFFPKNAGSNLPTHLAMIMLFRPDTGQPLAFMDGRLIYRDANRGSLRRSNEVSCVTGEQDPRPARKRRSGARTFAGSSPCVPVRRDSRVEPDAGSRQAFRRAARRNSDGP